jgi:hypothetical protein
LGKGQLAKVADLETFCKSKVIPKQKIQKGGRPSKARQKPGSHELVAVEMLTVNCVPWYYVCKVLLCALEAIIEQLV